MVALSISWKPTAVDVRALAGLDIEQAARIIADNAGEAIVPNLEQLLARHHEVCPWMQLAAIDAHGNLVGVAIGAPHPTLHDVSLHHALVVVREARGTGVGERLLRAHLNVFRDFSYQRVRFLCPEPLRKCIRLYDGVGFRVEGVDYSWADAGLRDALRLYVLEYRL